MRTTHSVETDQALDASADTAEGTVEGTVEDWWFLDGGPTPFPREDDGPIGRPAPSLQISLAVPSALFTLVLLAGAAALGLL